MHRLPFRLAATTATAVAIVAVSAACSGGDSTRPPAAPRDTVVTAGVQVPARAYVGDTLALVPALVVTDGDGRAIAGVPVSYEIVAGGGRLEGTDARSGTDGRVLVGRWVLGGAPGTNTLRVVVAGRAVTFTTTTIERPPVAWQWQLVGAPLGETKIEGLVVDPGDDRRWYVTAIQRGLFVTTDAGATWRQALQGVGLNKYGVAIDPRDPAIVYAAVGRDIWASADRGITWTQRASLAQGVRSIHVAADGTLFVAPQWPHDAVPGVYVSTDGGRTFVHHPYGVAAGTQILTWHLFESPATGSLFAANEIADHPSPYHPPLLRSRDRGVTWEDVTGTLPWHVVDMAYDAAGGRLLALTEGAGLWGSTDDGATWSVLATQGLGSALLVDPRHAGWVYIGQIFYQGRQGGTWISTNGGAAPMLFGLKGIFIAALATNHAGTWLYATGYDSGIWRAWIGDTPPGAVP